MKPYGLRKADRGCCPGHDKHPHPKEVTRKSKNFKRWNRSMRKRARNVKYEE